jgi:GntR family transcriptional regulator
MCSLFLQLVLTTLHICAIIDREMETKLNPDSPYPLYFQLYRLLKERIENGEYGQDEKIPSENELSRTFGIGRPTVRQATDRLIREGLIERRKGSGAFVRNLQRQVELFSLAGTSAAFHESGIELEQRIVDPLVLADIEAPRTAGKKSEPADTSGAKAERGDSSNTGFGNPFEGRRCYFFSRISLVDREPVLFEFIYLDPEVFVGIERFSIEGASLARIVEEFYFMKPVGGSQRISVAFLDPARAAAFGTDERTPLLLARRTLDFKPKDRAIYSDIYCRTERFEFTQDLGGLFHV